MKKAPLASKPGVDHAKPLKSKENIIATTKDLRKPSKKTKKPLKQEISHVIGKSSEKGP
jgi:hypothetical protein